MAARVFDRGIREKLTGLFDGKGKKSTAGVCKLELKLKVRIPDDPKDGNYRDWHPMEKNPERNGCGSRDGRKSGDGDTEEAIDSDTVCPDDESGEEGEDGSVAENMTPEEARDRILEILDAEGSGRGALFREMEWAPRGIRNLMVVNHYIPVSTEISKWICRREMVFGLKRVGRMFSGIWEVDAVENPPAESVGHRFRGLFDKWLGNFSARRCEAGFSMEGKASKLRRDRFRVQSYRGTVIVFGSEGYREPLMLTPDGRAVVTLHFENPLRCRILKALRWRCHRHGLRPRGHGCGCRPGKGIDPGDGGYPGDETSGGGDPDDGGDPGDIEPGDGDTDGGDPDGGGGDGNTGGGKGKGNNGHGNNDDGVDTSNPGKSKDGQDTDPGLDDEKKKK